MNSTLCHIVLADDNALFRLNLKRLLQEECDLEVTSEVGDGLELLRFLNAVAEAPQLAIVDISMPNLGGIEATSQIKNAHPEVKVLILTMHREKEYIRVAFGAGADG